ncbi:putative phosphoglycerate mutase [Paenibacillus methanolicus]|uniref:Putative phosphoglycerate mutase n=1 Tax=Paenibacillus methanolicus TaxID=582686 RepID=A0A5S5CED6_9BACL|nr:putative phosphoglycerate mutase [Paenibacillus methanolicus]
MAQRLRRDDERWDAIVASDLSRADETANIIAQTLGIPQLPGDPRLRERYFGEIEGTTEEERLTRWGADWRSQNRGQETDDVLRGRAMAFVEDLVAQGLDNRRILVVTHGSLLAQLLKGLCAELADKLIDNVSLSIFEREPERWKPLLHNCTLHLDDLARA